MQAAIQELTKRRTTLKDQVQQAIFYLQATIQELTERRTTLKDQVQQATLAAFVNSGRRSDVQATTAAITAVESQLREQATLREGALRQVARSEHTCALALLDRADLQRKMDSIMGSVGVEGKKAVAAARAEVRDVRGQLEEAVAESATLSSAFELARGAHAAAQVLIPPPCDTLIVLLPPEVLQRGICCLADPRHALTPDNRLDSMEGGM